MANESRAGRIRRAIRRDAAGNPAQQTAPYGQPVTDQDGAFQGTPEAIAIEEQKRGDTEAWEDANDVGGNYPGENANADTGPYEASVALVREAIMNPVEADAGEALEALGRVAAASPLSNWGRVVTCPDCRGEGDCTACYRDKTASTCAYCGGSRVCPTCKGSTFARTAPAEAPAKAASAAPVQATIQAAGPEDAVGARAVIRAEGRVMLGRVAAVSDDGRLLVQWRDGTKTVEKTSDYTFEGG